MSNKAVISLTTGLEDAEKVTVAFLVSVGAAESGRPTLMFLTKEAVRLALDGVAVGVACEGCPPLPDLLRREEAGQGRPRLQRRTRRHRPDVEMDRRRSGHHIQLLIRSRQESAGRHLEEGVVVVHVVPLVDTGLGNSSYLVEIGDGRALVIDPSRDLRAVDAAAERHGLRVVAAADTHLHADFLSGATRLAARDDATVYASAAGGREFPHTGLGDGDQVDLGGLTLRAWATPGHTGEHVAYLLLDGETTLGVFTGGSLIVGAAARTDLASPEQTQPLARAQYASLQRLATLPDDTPVWPTHGAGSFCSAPPGAERTTTIGREKAY